MNTTIVPLPYVMRIVDRSCGCPLDEFAVAVVIQWVDSSVDSEVFAISNLGKTHRIAPDACELAQ